MQSITDPATKKKIIQTRKQKLTRVLKIQHKSYLDVISTYAYKNLLLCPHLQLFVYTSGGSLEMRIVQQNNYLKHF